MPCASVLPRSALDCAAALSMTGAKSARLKHAAARLRLHGIVAQPLSPDCFILYAAATRRVVDMDQCMAIQPAALCKCVIVNAETKKDRADMRIVTTGIAAIVALIIFSGHGFAQNSGRCQAYWQERNAILKENRYCFKSPRAIHYFGNGGCAYNTIEDIPFPIAQLNRMLEIRAMEKVEKCGGRLTFAPPDGRLQQGT